MSHGLTTRIARRLRAEWRALPLMRARKCDNPVRWGIIGLGNMGETLARAIDGSRGGVVHAAASRDMAKARRFAARHGGCRAYGSYGDMAGDQSLRLDLVYIATPAARHYEDIKLCLEAGRNVLCEKPITLRSDELRELADIAEQKQCLLMEGMWMKCLPTFRQAKEWLREGRIGRLQLVRATLHKRERIDPRHTIFNAKEGGGVLNDYGVYALAFAEAFLGRDLTVRSVARRVSPAGLDTDWGVLLRSGGVEAMVSLSSGFATGSKAELVGTEGSVEFDSQFNRSGRVALFAADGAPVCAKAFRYTFDGFEHEVEEAHRCVRAGTRASGVMPLEDTLRVVRLMEQLRATE